jgi:hypothetical protein
VLKLLQQSFSRHKKDTKGLIFFSQYNQYQNYIMTFFSLENAKISFKRNKSLKPNLAELISKNYC